MGAKLSSILMLWSVWAELARTSSRSLPSPPARKLWAEGRTSLPPSARRPPALQCITFSRLLHRLPYCSPRRVASRPRRIKGRASSGPTHHFSRLSAGCGSRNCVDPAARARPASPDPVWPVLGDRWLDSHALGSGHHGLVPCLGWAAISCLLA